MTSKPKSRTIVAQNKAHTLFKLFSGRVVTIKKVVRQIGNGYKYYDLKNIEISYSIKDNKTYLYSVGDSDNLENVPVTDIKFTSSLLFRYRKRGTIIAQNPEHNLFKLYSGRVVTKQHIVKQINKGHKFYDLKNAKITYFTVGDDTFLRSTSDGTTKNNLVEVPNVILSLNKKTVHKSSAIKERLYIKSHQRKVLATILIGSILLGEPRRPCVRYSLNVMVATNHNHQDHQHHQIHQLRLLITLMVVIGKVE